MIRFENVEKWYDNFHVLKDVCLQVERGTVCLLCGESGAGKSTLLATVNGLEPIQRGQIWVDGVRLGDRRVNLRVLRTQIGVVYQSYNLFGHMTAEANIRIGLEKALKLGRKEATWRAAHYLERVGLLDKRHAYPAELSGGQQQRVAIARCLAMHPKIMLLDEPTSALDMDNVQEVLDTIRLLVNDGITILLATHQLPVFVDLADHVVCMEDGAILEQGSVSQILQDQECDSKLATWLRSLATVNTTAVGRSNGDRAGERKEVLHP